MILPLLAGLAASSAAPFPACCAYGGAGGAVALGVGVLNAFAPLAPGNGPPSGPSYAAPMAIGVSPSRLFTSILFAAASGPDDAQAGWIITSNETNDVIFVFSNVSASGPRCSAGVGPRGSFVGNYRLCSGPGGLFPHALRDFRLTPATRVGLFTQDKNVSTVAFADERACTPVSIVGTDSPFGTGAFSVDFESGVAAEPPAAWSGPPSWCDGHWATPGARDVVESLRKA